MQDHDQETPWTASPAGPAGRRAGPGLGGGHRRRPGRLRPEPAGEQGRAIFSLYNFFMAVAAVVL